LSEIFENIHEILPALRFLKGVRDTTARAVISEVS